jgi:heptosyltransferase-1
MKILIVKTSSLGDVIHTLPALTDAAQVYPEVQFDWVVEENFAEIPSWHPCVHRVIPIAWRSWRKNLCRAWQQKQIQPFYAALRETQYDKIIDAQGLLKSACIGRLARGMHCGLDYRSAREPLASLLYQKRYTVNFHQHAVTRARQLFAQVFAYAIPVEKPDYAIRAHFGSPHISKNILFVHGTTWKTKEWPASFWIDLAKRCVAAGWHVQIPWGNTEEKERAAHIAATDPHIEVLPKTTLIELTSLLLQAKATIAVDTGIGHLAAALSVPTISLYGPTNPIYIGALGENQIHLQKTDRMEDISVDMVWEKLSNLPPMAGL